MLEMLRFEIELRSHVTELDQMVLLWLHFERAHNVMYSVTVDYQLNQ